MGNGQGPSFGIFIVAILIVSSIISSNSFYVNEIKQKAEDEEYDRLNVSEKTSLIITDYSYDVTGTALEISVFNSGTTIWDNPDEFDVISSIAYLDEDWNYTNGAWIPYKNLNASITSEPIYWDYEIISQNSINPNFADPDETVNFTIYTDKIIDGTAFWIRITTSNGIGDFLELIQDYRIIYSQNFNTETIGEYPTGWTNIVDQPPANGDFRVIGPAGQFTTNSLVVSDPKPNKYVSGLYVFNEGVIDGNFSFDISHTWDAGSETDCSIILEDSTGTDLITIRIFRTAAEDWRFTAQGNGASYTSSYYTQTDLKSIAVEFDGSTFDVIIDDVTVSSELSYSGGQIEQLNIYTEVIADDFQIFLDNFELISYI
jgi:archaellum component FlaF (FlaF/FlaG flagellin family)